MMNTANHAAVPVPSLSIEVSSKGNDDFEVIPEIEAATCGSSPSNALICKGECSNLVPLCTPSLCSARGHHEMIHGIAMSRDFLPLKRIFTITKMRSSAMCTFSHPCTIH